MPYHADTDDESEHTTGIGSSPGKYFQPVKFADTCSDLLTENASRAAAFSTDCSRYSLC